MGSSKPPAADVDLVNSFARLLDDEVEVVLADPGPELVAGSTIVLRARNGVHRGTLALNNGARGRRGVVRFQRAALTDGQYVLRMETGATQWPLGCRLLVQGPRPLVLLWGTKALPSRLPVPHRRPRAKRTPAQRVRSLGGRARRELSRRVRGWA